jgi:hypothetical protein
MFSACKKEKSAINFKPTFTKVDFTQKVPLSLQQNSPIAFSQINMMGAYMNLASNLMSSTGKISGTDVNNTTWNYGPYTVTYDVTQTGNRYVFVYTISLNGQVYYTINGWENTDASAGHWNYNLNTSVLGYTQNSSDYNISFDWSRSGNGYNFEMTFDMGTTQLMHYVAQLNDDYSGYFNYELNGSPYYGCVWNANGNGYFTDYTTTPPTVTNF